MKAIENYAIRMAPFDGKCRNSPFASGGHRCGLIPVLSVLDGGAPGDSCRWICLHCGKDTGESFFVLINQPRSLKARQAEPGKDGR